MNKHKLEATPSNTKKTYKDYVLAFDNLVQSLTEFSGVKHDLVQSVARFSKCLVKPNTASIDYPIFSVVLSKFFGIDQAFHTVLFERLRRKRRRMNEFISLEDFAHLVCIFLSEDRDVQTEFVHSVYDLDDDGLVDAKEVEHLVKACKCVTDVDVLDRSETLSEMSIMAMEHLGISRDGGLNLEDFREKVADNPLAINILGRAIPPRMFAERFKNRIRRMSSADMMATFGNIRQELLREVGPRHDVMEQVYPFKLDLP